MRIGRICMFFLVLTLAPLASLGASNSPYSLSQLKRILRKQGFDGALTGDVTFTYLGHIRCEKNEYHAYYFVWTQTRLRGVDPHGQQRIILVSNTEQYAGSYVIEDPPRAIEHNAIIFPYDTRDGNEIQCDADGLPREAHLDGDFIPIEK